MHVNRNTLIVAAGLIWLAGSFALMKLGLGFFWAIAQGHESSSFLTAWMRPLLGSWTSTLLLSVLACGVGYAKGKFILSKTVKREIARISELPSRPKIYQIYGRVTLILIFSMMLISSLFKRLGLPIDLRAFIDMAIGIALLTGSSLYFRVARQGPKSI